jgi:hypothetical protein
VAGVIMPENASLVFRTPLELVRALLVRYRELTGYDATDNRFDPPVARDWLVLDPKQRRERLESALDELGPALGLDAGTVQVMGVQNGAKVRVAFSDAVGRERRHRILVDLEAGLQRRVEPTLTLELEVRPDRNEIRRL